MKNLIHVIIYVCFPQIGIFAELELNQTKPQFRFSESREETKTCAKMLNAMLLILSISYLKGLKHRNFLLFYSFIIKLLNSLKISFYWDKISDLGVEAITFFTYQYFTITRWIQYTHKANK